MERRAARRFEVDWEVAVHGSDEEGSPIDQSGSVRNISSSGALILLKKAVPVGTRLEVLVRVPMKRDNWMKYSASVVRVEAAASRKEIALKFDTARPVFVAG